MRWHYLLFAAPVLLCACDDSNGGPPPDHLPERFRLEGTASLQSGELTLECHIDFLVELAGETARTDAYVEYVGTMGGEAGRSIRAPDDSGLDLVGDTFSEVRARLTFPDAVLIESINLPPSIEHDPPGFFAELTRFEGTLSGADSMTGEWVCAPTFSARDGFLDDTLFADGVWFTEVVDQ